MSELFRSQDDTCLGRELAYGDIPVHLLPPFYLMLEVAGFEGVIRVARVSICNTFCEWYTLMLLLSGSEEMNI